MGSTREASRNGTGTQNPSKGEKGTSHVWDPGEAGIRPSDMIHRRPRPSPAALDHMFAVDGWAEAMHSALTWPIRRPKWSIVEADGDSGEADLCRAQLEPLMRKLVAGMTGAVGRGIAPAELVWDRDTDGTIVLVDVAFRPISTCTLERDRNGRIIGFKQVALTGVGGGLVNEKFLFSERKAFVYAHDSTSGPGGRSAFETAYHYFEDKRKVLFYRFKNLERFGGPSVHGQTKETSGDKYEAFAQSLDDLRSGGTAVTHPDESINVLNNPNAGVAFRQAINDLNFEMAVSVLVQWLGYAQEGNSGSYNASDVQNRLMEDVTEGRTAEMQDEARILCRHICELNVGPDAAVPRIDAESIAREPQELAKEGAEKVYEDYEMPEWFAEAVAEAWGRMLRVEKPEGSSWIGARRKPAPSSTPPASDAGAPDEETPSGETDEEDEGS